MDVQTRAQEEISGLKRQAHEAMHAEFAEQRARQLDCTRRVLGAVGIEVPEEGVETAAMVDAKGQRWHALCFDDLAFSVDLSSPDRPMVWMDHLERFVPFYSLAQLGEMLQRAGVGTVRMTVQEREAIHRINVTAGMLRAAIVNEYEAREAVEMLQRDCDVIEARIVLGAYDGGHIDGRNAQIRDRQETTVIADSSACQQARERLQDARHAAAEFEAERRRMEALVRLEVARLRVGNGGG